MIWIRHTATSLLVAAGAAVLALAFGWGTDIAIGAAILIGSGWFVEGGPR